LVLVAGFIPGCGSSGPEEIYWDLSGDSVEQVGWPVSNKAGDWSRDGDFDIIIVFKGKQVFHERAVHFFVVRDSWRISDWGIIFRVNISLEDARTEARRVLTKYSGGVQQHPGPGDLTLDEWYDGMKAGKLYEDQYRFGGDGTGTICITTIGRGPGAKCTLMMNP
jgi:hypothetical protein